MDLRRSRVVGRDVRFRHTEGARAPPVGSAPVTDVAREYLELCLRLGRHVDGLVDAYYGPADISERVEAEELRAPAALVQDADSLLEEADDGWLRAQLVGLETVAHKLAGEEIPYEDEVERCYGVRPEWVPEESFEAAHRELDELLPGDGTVAERYQAWREGNQLEGDQLTTVYTKLLDDFRSRTKDLFDLPEGESVEVDYVTDEPWAAFNYYLGGHRSRIVVNTDLPFSGAELVHLAAHEGYPGHHTEHATKEELLLDRQGHLEESLQLVPTPQALLSEGIAELGGELLIDDALEEELAEVVRAAGVPYDPAEAAAVRAAREPLGYVSRNAALAIHEDGLALHEAQAYIEQWALATPKRAAHSISFITDPTWRAYIVTYTEGLRLARAWVGDDVGRFARLLTEPVRVGELRAAADGEPAVSSAP